MAIRIDKVNCEFEREPLIRPFGFKGGYMSEIWQTMAYVRSEKYEGTGLGVQNVLWSDPQVFASTTVSGGNAAMFAITDRALHLAGQTSFETPVDLIEQIFEEVYDYAVTITGRKNLSKTFVLNALVPVDNAAWILYAREYGKEHFDHIIPGDYRPALSHKHSKVASIPIASYGMALEEVRNLVERDDYFILKIKLGAPGSQQEMLEADKKRIEEIHKSIGHREISYTEDGKLPYYLDANGRYESKQTLEALLDHARKIGAFDQIKIVEEPFPEQYEVDVTDLDINIVADESAHTAKNVAERIEMGYGAIALKPVAKTLSTTFQMAREAYDKQTPCFCADLTVNPILVDWNKNVAARLAPLPGFDIGLLETNGHQNYQRWSLMKEFHPRKGEDWLDSADGVFQLGDDFYEKSGGIFEDSIHYRSQVAL